MRVFIDLPRFAMALAALTATWGIASASATNVYIAQSAVGVADGSSCANARAYTFFNSASNWGSGSAQIGPGSTVHLCGIFTFAAGATGLAAQGSGASGQPITIHFEAGAILQAPDFGSGGAALRLSNLSYITVDGGGTGNAGAGTFVPSGIIQATLSGTAGAACIGGPCTQNNGSTGIAAGNATNITIKNLLIRSMYLRTSYADQAPDWSSYFCISAFPGATNLLIDNNVMTDSGEIIAATGSNMIIRNNDISNTNHGLSTGLAAVSYSRAYIYGNHFHDMTSWDAGSPYPYHHDGIHFFQNPGPGFWDQVYIYNNQFDGDIGEGNTGWIYMETTCCTGGKIYIFNNVAALPPTRSSPGVIGFYSGNIFFANNTVFGGSYTNGGVACDIGHNDATIATWQNTICQGQSVSFNVQPSSAVSGTTAIDNNLVGDGSSFGNQQNYSYQGNNTQSLTTWQGIALIGAVTHDTHSRLTVNLMLNVDGTLQAGSPAIAAGANLFSVCSGQAIPGLGALCSDKIGKTRPALGNWDVGAYNSGTGVQLTPPSGMVSLIQ